jgi:hypothetical protein
MINNNKEEQNPQQHCMKTWNLEAKLISVIKEWLKEENETAEENVGELDFWLNFVSRLEASTFGAVPCPFDKRQYVQ